MRGQNFLPATALPADSKRSILILHGILELINISILLFCATGIISTGRMHLYLALLFHRDYFHRPDASLSCSFVPQGLFRPVRCISIWLFCSTGIISPRPDASLSCSFAPQGLFRPARCISIWLFCSTGIISPQSDTSPIAENISASPFRQLPVFELKQSVFIFFIAS